MSPILIPVVALMIPMVVVPASLWARHAHRVRELEHAERLQALELGQDPRPAPGINWPGAAVCIALGAGVPIGSMLAAWLAVVTSGAANPINGNVFGIALVISALGLWAARDLADRMLAVAAGATIDESPGARAGGKPSFDPDAYDVVGSRG